MKTHDPFPTQGRYRQRYQPTQLDPLELELARAEAAEAQARDEIRRGITRQASPEDLRGIPVLAPGVGGKVRVHRDELH